MTTTAASTQRRNLISPAAEKGIRVASTIAVFAVFTAALILSWNGLAQLAVSAGFKEQLSWLLPVAIDGMVIAGGLNVLHASLTKQGTLFGWCLTILGAIISVWGNVVAYNGQDIASQTVHGLAPMTMALSLEAFLRIIRGRITATQEHEVEDAKRKQAEERAAKRRATQSQRKKASPPPATPTLTKKPVESPNSLTTEKENAQQAASPSMPKGTSYVSIAPEDAIGNNDIPIASGEEVITQMKEIIGRLPEDSTNVDKAFAIIQTFPRPASKDLAIALGREPDEAGSRSAQRALSRARKRLTSDQ